MNVTAEEVGETCKRASRIDAFPLVFGDYRNATVETAAAIDILRTW